jgi:CubicO group peptidase (beta-lactamase class C family)
MTRNHLPGGADLASVGRPISAESMFEGQGFGLGFSVLVDPAAAKVLSSPGEFAWSGLARTEFFVDPVEEITAMFFTQLLPGPTYPLRGHLRGIVRAAVVD